MRIPGVALAVAWVRGGFSASILGETKAAQLLCINLGKNLWELWVRILRPLSARNVNEVIFGSGDCAATDWSASEVVLPLVDRLMEGLCHFCPDHTRQSAFYRSGGARDGGGCGDLKLHCVIDCRKIPDRCGVTPVRVLLVQAAARRIRNSPLT